MQEIRVMNSTVEDVKRYLLKARELEEYLLSDEWKSLEPEEEIMNIVSVRYRFLRLNSTTLALVELYPFSNRPEVCQQLYPVAPYLTFSRLSFLNSVYNTEELREWIKEQEYDFRNSLSEACNYPDIDFNKNLYETKETILWNYLDPLEDVFWDEYCPLFDNDYNFILRN